MSRTDPQDCGLESKAETEAEGSLHETVAPCIGHTRDFENAAGEITTGIRTKARDVRRGAAELRCVGEVHGFGAELKTYALSESELAEDTGESGGGSSSAA